MMYLDGNERVMIYVQNGMREQFESDLSVKQRLVIEITHFV